MGINVHMSGIVINLPRSAFPVEMSLFTGGIFGTKYMQEDGLTTTELQA